MKNVRIVQTDRGVEIDVKVVPGASRSRMMGAHGDALRVAICAPPERGKANAALTRLFADTLELRAADIELLSGHTNPRKRLLLIGVDASAVRAALERLSA